MRGQTGKSRKAGNKPLQYRGWFSVAKFAEVTVVGPMSRHDLAVELLRAVERDHSIRHVYIERA
jgi:hypothetical protein